MTEVKLDISSISAQYSQNNIRKFISFQLEKIKRAEAVMNDLKVFGESPTIGVIQSEQQQDVMTY